MNLKELQAVNEGKAEGKGKGKMSEKWRRNKKIIKNKVELIVKIHVSMYHKDLQSFSLIHLRAALHHHNLQKLLLPSIAILDTQIFVA